MDSQASIVGVQAPGNVRGDADIRSMRLVHGLQQVNEALAVRHRTCGCKMAACLMRRELAKRVAAITLMMFLIA
jgi:hypothetical protein